MRSTPVSARRLVAALFALAVWPAALSAADGPEVVVVGEGPSPLVEYDLELRPLREYRGFVQPTDVTPLADESILVVDPGTDGIVAMSRDGTIRWRTSLVGQPSRARPLPDGGLLVSRFGEAVALDAAHEIVWKLAVPGLKAAVPLANGNVLVAYNDRQGRLAEMTRRGQTVWISKPLGHPDASGRWIDEDPNQTYQSVAALDVAPDGRIFTTNYDEHELRVLSPRYELQRSFKVLRHVLDTRFGPGGALVAASSEAFAVWLELPDGTTKMLHPPLRPLCAALTPWNTLLVGLYREPEQEVLNATRRREAETPPVEWWRRPLPLPLGGALLALASALLLRLPEVRRRRAAAPGAAAERAPRPAGAGSVRAAVGVVAGVGLAGGLALAWSGLSAFLPNDFTADAWRFAAGCVIAGVALRVLDGVAGSPASLSCFPAPPAPARADARGLLLLVLSLLSLAACLAILFDRPEEQAAAIALWLAAQIWIVAAAYPPSARSATERPATMPLRLAVLLLVVFAAVTRLWQLGYYPDRIHHDHNLYGLAILFPLRGEWTPFFVMDPYSGSTYSRPWLVPAIAATWLLGADYDVLRLTAALWSVVMVGAAYLLGTELFNRRVGLIGAALTAVNHVLLLYSRQPYVIESTPPFLLAVYCAVVALKRGSRFHWCLAGVLAGWSMISVRQFTIYPFIGAAFLGYLACTDPRRLWRQRAGLGWLVAGILAVYLPILPQTSADQPLFGRLRATVPFFNPDGSIRWDLQLWMHQIGRSFGAVFVYRDNAAWQVGTGKPITIGIEKCLFGIGLTYLLSWWRTPATFVVLSTVAISIFLGSAMLISPPTYYHFLVAIVAMTFVSAVACDRFLALSDHRRKGLRIAAAVAVAAVVAWVGADHLGSVWAGLRRHAPAADGATVYNAHPEDLVARYIRRHPAWRYYLIRTPPDLSARSPILRFAAEDSDVFDVTTDLDDLLPVPPVDPAPGAAFVVLPSRADDGARIPAVYPEARADKLYAYGFAPVWIYRVDAAAIAAARPEPAPGEGAREEGG